MRHAAGRGCVDVCRLWHSVCFIWTSYANAGGVSKSANTFLAVQQQDWKKINTALRWQHLWYCGEKTPVTWRPMSKHSVTMEVFTCFVTGEKSVILFNVIRRSQSWNYEKWSELCCINVTIVIKKKPFATAMKGGGGGGNSKISSNQMMSQ